MIQAEALLTRLRDGEVLLADGATGTMLQGQGLETGRIPEIWLFEKPSQILALHRSYIEAGADLILTCTFGGTRYRLEGEGLADRVVDVNRRAAELAREAAGEAVQKSIFVVGDMGPTGKLLAPLGLLTPEAVADAYSEQASGLSEGKVDLLLIETMSDLREAQAAIEGARRVTDLPIACTFSFDTHGRTMMGLKPETVAQEIGPLVDLVGANCGHDPAEFVGFIQAMRRATPLAILWAKPNAGMPHLVDDRAVYDASPEYMGQLAWQLAEAGARVIGGCCGTTPAHIAAMATSLEKRRQNDR